MSDTLRMELKPFGIQVTVVAPGIKKSINKRRGLINACPYQVPFDPTLEQLEKQAILCQKVSIKNIMRGAMCENKRGRKGNSDMYGIGSLYAPVANYIIARASLSQGNSKWWGTTRGDSNMITLGPHSTPTEVFASRVVKKVSQATAPRYITTGAMSWIFIVLYYLPLFIKEFLFNKRFGVFDLEKKTK